MAKTREEIIQDGAVAAYDFALRKAPNDTKTAAALAAAAGEALADALGLKATPPAAKAAKTKTAE